MKRFANTKHQGEMSTSPYVVVDPSMPLMHLYMPTLYKSRDLKGCFFASALLLESTLLFYSTPKVFGEGASWRLFLVSWWVFHLL